MTAPSLTQSCELHPRISLAGARAAYIGPSLRLAPHRNAAVTLAVSLGAPFSLTLFGAGANSSGRMDIALIPAGTRHHLQAESSMIFIYLDPLADDIAGLSALDLAQARARLMRECGPAFDGDVDALCTVLGIARRPDPDHRIAAIQAQMAWRPDIYRRTSDAARAVNLSPSRFHALFRQGLGVPFRRYRLWRRIAVVAQRLAEGDNLTSAAHHAGFASSSHLSTVFRAFFGLTPSALLAGGISIIMTQEPIAAPSPPVLHRFSPKV